jgi:glycerate kinase
VDLIAEASGLADHVAGAGLVLTGEGRLDAQSARGKAPAGVARIARAAGVPAVVVAGALGDGYERIHDCGAAAAFCISRGPGPLDMAIAEAPERLRAAAETIARLWRVAGWAR